MHERPLPVPDYVAFDIETTGLSPEQDHIIEVAFVRFENGLPVEKWSSLVRPLKKVGLKVLRLTGISREDLAQSPDISSIILDLEEFRGHLPLVGHNSDFDVSFLSKAVPGFPGVPVYDTLELTRITFPGFKTYKLGDLAKEFHVSLDDAHRACDDAQATGMVFAKVQRRIAALPETVKEKILLFMGKDWEAAKLFEAGPCPPAQRELPIFPSLPPHRLFAGREKGPGETEDWKDLSFGLAPLFKKKEEDEVLFVDSPLDEVRLAGLSKTLKRHASTLDRPLLAAGSPQVLAEIQGDAQFLSLPHGYLCLFKAHLAQKLAETGLLGHLEAEDKRFLSTIALWKNMTCQGLFNEIQLVGRAFALARELACTEFPDCREGCPYSGTCFYSEALEKAAAPGRVVTTLTQDCFHVSLKADACIIIDSNNLGTLWERKQPRLHLGDLREVLKGLGLKDCADEVEGIIHLSLQDLGTKRDMMVTPRTLDLLKKSLSELKRLVPGLRQELRAQVATLLPPSVDPPILGMALHNLEYWIDQMEGILDEKGSSKKLVEKGYGDAGGASSVISSKWIWPAVNAKRDLREKFGRVALMSPMTGFASEFHGLRRFYGLESETVFSLTDPVPSKRTESECGLLLLSIDKGRRLSFLEHVSLVGEFLKDLALKSKENLLCLCPSYSFIQALNSRVAGGLEDEDIAVFAQGMDGGPRVVEHFNEPRTLILARFGVALPKTPAVLPRILIIPKIPFWPPNTLDDLRQKEAFNAGKNGFVEVSVMPTVLTLRSYIHDLWGSAVNPAVVFLDPRLLPGQSRWGKEFISQFDDTKTVVCPKEAGVQHVLDWIGDKS